MKIHKIAVTIGVIIAALGLVGLVGGEGRMLSEINIDLPLDLIRIVLGAFLIYGGIKSPELSRTSLTIFGVAYLLIFVLGIISYTLFGLLPTGLGWIDQGLHIIGGAIALYFSRRTST